MKQFMDVYQKAKTAEDRTKLVQEKYPQPQPYVRRFLEIADSAPQDAAAVDALIWIVHAAFRSRGQRGHRPARDQPRRERAGWARSPRAGLLHCRRRRRSSSAPIVEKNPERDAKGRACLALGQYLKKQSELVRTLKTDPEQAQTDRGRLTSQGVDKASFDRFVKGIPTP